MLIFVAVAVSKNGQGNTETGEPKEGAMDYTIPEDLYKDTK